MIGKTKWFTKRKYSGWGLVPKTWQGWVYVLAFIVLVLLVNFLPIALKVKLIITIIIIAIFLVDVVHILLTMPKNAEEIKQEAIADRNALWGLLVVLILGLIYQSIISAINNTWLQVDYFLVIAILTAAIIRGITFYYLEREK